LRELESWGVGELGSWRVGELERGEQSNPKFQILNPKQIQNPNDPNSK
jgi:hypothetical protein